MYLHTHWFSQLSPPLTGMKGLWGQGLVLVPVVSPVSRIVPDTDRYLRSEQTKSCKWLSETNHGLWGFCLKGDPWLRTPLFYPLSSEGSFHSNCDAQWCPVKTLWLPGQTELLEGSNCTLNVFKSPAFHVIVNALIDVCWMNKWMYSGPWTCRKENQHRVKEVSKQVVTECLLHTVHCSKHHWATQKIEKVYFLCFRHLQST